MYINQIKCTYLVFIFVYRVGQGTAIECCYSLYVELCANNEFMMFDKIDKT